MDSSVIDRRGFIGGVASMAALGGCSSLWRGKQGRFQFGEDGTFRFLQLTDLHLRPNGWKLHPRAEATIRAAFSKYRPSLVVLTGDNVNGQEGEINAHGKFEESVGPLLGLFRVYGVPFCVAFGNHDSERTGPGRYSRQEQYGVYGKMGGDLFVDHDVPWLSGVGSGVVGICRRGTDTPGFNLFVMDSGDYPEHNPKYGYEGCRSDQIEWYERVSGNTPCLWFQHIIVPDVNVHGMFTLLPKTDGPKPKEGPEAGYDMSWPDGQRRMLLAPGVSGELKEHTCPPHWGTYRDGQHTFEGRTLYDSWCKMGNMKGAFFGHDHMNTFVGTDENGICIGMTKCCSMWTYNDGNIGARAFALHDDGTYDTEIFAESDIPSTPSGVRMG